MTTTPRDERKSFQFLDGLRGLTAVYVACGHAQGLLWEGAASPELRPDRYTGLNRVARLFIFGHAAVIFFFVLSGFVIHLRYSRDLKATGACATFDWAPYVKRRARRLYPTLLFAMALTLAIDQLGAGLGYAIYAHATPYTELNERITSDHAPLTAIGNLAFVAAPTWGSNEPLWSLKNEWWFYMIYPAVWWVSRRSIPLATAGLAALFVLTLFPAAWPWAMPRVVFTSMIVWWFGALLADVFSGRIAIPMRAVVGLGPIAFIAPILPVSPVMRDLLYGIGFTGCLAGLFALRDRGWQLRVLSRLKPLGDMSFTLYVIHFPILVLASGWLMSRSSAQALPTHLAWSATGVVVCLVLAYLAHFVTERPFVKRRT